jgi:hypothetical protein
MPKPGKKNIEPPGSFSRNTEKHVHIILLKNSKERLQNPKKDPNSQPCILFFPSLPLPFGYPDISGSFFPLSASYGSLRAFFRLW